MKNAFNYSQEYIHLKDSLVDVKNAKDFSALQIKFNNLTHQFKIEKLNQENQQYQLKMRKHDFFYYAFVGYYCSGYFIIKSWATVLKNMRY
ncbi:MAG: hypothetical protein U0T36_06485 [Saprospiraceae bacterium]